MEFLDPDIVELITYIDEDGKRRVKPPYRNRRIYSLIVPPHSGVYVVTVPEPIQNKIVTLLFPGSKAYDYRVFVDRNVVEVYDIPEGTFFEIHVYSLTPIEKSDKDPIWDELPYDAKKALVVAWSDLICNDNFKAQVNVEWDFDKQDTLYQKIVAFRNNKGNNKSRDF